MDPADFLRAVKPIYFLHFWHFRHFFGPKIYFPDLVSFAVLGFLISGVRKLLTWATFWISDFEEGGAAELGGGALGLGIDRRRCSWWRPAWRVWCGLGASKRCYTSLSQTSTRSRASLQGRRCIVHSRYQVLRPPALLIRKSEH